MEGTIFLVVLDKSLIDSLGEFKVERHGWLWWVGGGWCLVERLQSRRLAVFRQAGLLVVLVVCGCACGRVCLRAGVCVCGCAYIYVN
jgi:hypothetical protein